MTPESPQLFGPYRLLGEIARGGMAVVHYAVRRDDPSGPMLAVKTILPAYAHDPNFKRFFSAEIDLTRSLGHPNVISVVDAGDVGGLPYLAMEYVHGRALNRVLHALAQQGKKLPLPYAVHVAICALEGMDYAHHARDSNGRDLNVVLCDISPSNIMVGYDGQVKLIDFGIATSRMKFFEQIGLLKGKKNYMAPEQLRGLPLDLRADIFAMGICVHELLTSQAFFAGRSEFEIEQALRSGELPSLREKLKGMPTGLADAIARALASDPAQRYGSAAEFARALDPYAKLSKGESVSAAALSKVLAMYLGELIRQDSARLTEVRARPHAAAAPGAGEEVDSSELPTSRSPLPGDGH